MCFMCLKDDVFGPPQPKKQQLLRERAKHVKQLLSEAEERRMEMCYVGDAAVDLLKQEQYDLAKQL